MKGAVGCDVLCSCVGWVWCVVISVHRTCVHLDKGWAGIIIPSVLLHFLPPIPSLVFPVLPGHDMGSEYSDSVTDILDSVLLLPDPSLLVEFYLLDYTFQPQT